MVREKERKRKERKKENRKKEERKRKKTRGKERKKKEGRKRKKKERKRKKEGKRKEGKQKERKKTAIKKEGRERKEPSFSLLAHDVEHEFDGLLYSLLFAFRPLTKQASVQSANQPNHPTNRPTTICRHKKDRTKYMERNTGGS